MNPGVNPEIAQVDLYIRRGDTFRWRTTLSTVSGGPIDLTGYSFSAQARTVDLAGAICTITVDVIDAVHGVIEFVISAVTTSGIDVQFLLGKWAAKWVPPSGDVKTFLVGNVFFELDGDHA